MNDIFEQQATWSEHLDMFRIRGGYQKDMFAQTDKRREENLNDPVLKPILDKLEAMRQKYKYPIKPDLYSISKFGDEK